ncbi:MFS transporter [Cupriavidus basilensis]
MNSNGSFRAVRVSARGQMSFPSQALIVFGAALGLCAGFAPVYFGTISIFLKPIAQEFGWGRAQTSGAAVFSMLGTAVGAVVVGRLIDRCGAARVIPLSVLVTAALIGFLSRIDNNPIMYLILSLSIGLLGAGTTPPGYLSVLSRHFDKRLGLALGFAGIGMGVGTILLPILANYLVYAHGWRDAYVILGILSGIVGLIACFSLFFKRGRGVSGDAIKKQALSGGFGVTAVEALKGRRIWLLMIVVASVSIASLGVSVHFVSMLTDRGVTPALAAKAAAISGAGVVIGRVGCGYLIDRYHAPMIAAVVFLLAAIGVVLLPQAGEADFAWMALSGLLIGFALGAEGDFLPFLVREYFGIKEFGSIYGVLFFVHGLGGVLGPVLFGLSFDRFHTYSVALWGAAGLLCLASLLVSLTGRYQYPR